MPWESILPNSRALRGLQRDGRNHSQAITFFVDQSDLASRFYPALSDEAKLAHRFFLLFLRQTLSLIPALALCGSGLVSPVRLFILLARLVFLGRLSQLSSPVRW